MFGNTLGWIISAAITAVAAFGAYMLILAGIPTPPTDSGFLETAAKPLTLVVSADAFLKVTDPGADAGALYRDAITDYQNHSNEYEDLQRNTDYSKARADAAKLKGLTNLLKAANARYVGIFAGNPAKIINFDAHPDDLESLDAICKTAGMMSVSAKLEKDYPWAREYARAILVLGLRLYQERLAYLELAQGETLIGLGIAAVSNVDKADPSSAAAVQADDAFNTLYLNETRDLIQPIVKVLFTIGNDAAVSAEAGDMFQLATGSNYDRVWRVEAIHRLGRLQRNSDNKADQVKAPRILRQLSTDPREDAVIHLAADQSLNMTEGDYQSQR